MDSIIKGSFWTDTRVEESSAEVKLACLWLVSNPARDLCGFTTVSNKRFEFETGLTSSALEGASMGLPSSFVKLPGGVWFAVNFIRHQFGKGGKLSLGNKVVIAAARHAAKLREPLRRAFFEAYPELVVLVEHPLKNSSEKDAPSIPHTVKPDGVRVRVREGEENKEGCGEETGKPVDLWGIVQLYPKRHADKDALEALQSSVRKGTRPEEIEAGTRAIAAVIPKIPGGALNSYVVGAGSFFRGERWRDDPKTWLRNGSKTGEAHKAYEPNGRQPAEVVRLGRKP